MTRPFTVARNLAAKAWRRGSAVPKRAAHLAQRARIREQFEMLRAEWRVERELAALTRGRGPIIVGPWLSEVGFEVLYWIPFLRWFQDRYRVDRERVIAVSRGGVSSWYAEVANTYVDVFDQYDPGAFSQRNAERQASGEAGGQKQTRHGSFDTAVLQWVKHRADAEDATVCHPSLMYGLFNQFWSGNRPLDLAISHTRHRPLRVQRPADVPLPDRYVAVKFYTGAALPDTEEHRRVLRELVGTIARRLPVVVLDTGMTTDEHEDYLLGDLPNVLSVRRHLTPVTNLGIQTAVIAGAQAFVGTCGSLAWLAPMLGVDTIAVYSEDRFLVSHLFFATHVYRRIAAPRFDTLDLSAVMQFDLTAAMETVACRPQAGS